MSKTSNKFSPEVRERAVRLVLDTEAQHPSRWQAVILTTPEEVETWLTGDWVEARLQRPLREGLLREVAR